MTPEIERVARIIHFWRAKRATPEQQAIAVIKTLADPTDAMVEAAAKAYWEFDNANYRWETVGPAIHQDLTERMRAALRAGTLAALGRSE